MITLTAPQQFTLGVLGAAFLVLGTNSAQAAVLVDNHPPDFLTAIRSDFDSLPVEIGDDFKLTSSNVTKITWSGVYANTNLAASDQPATDQFSVRIFKFLKGKLNIAPTVAFDNISVNRSDNPQNPFFFSYSFTPTQSFTLKAGEYLLSVVNNTDDPTLDWFWARSGQEGNNFTRSNPGDTWFRDGNDAELSFTIEGNATSVPTPALLPGLIGLGISVWRKRKSAAND